MDIVTETKEEYRLRQWTKIIEECQASWEKSASRPANQWGQLKTWDCTPASDTPKGAEVSAAVYSIVETAKANNLTIIPIWITCSSICRIRITGSTRIFGWFDALLGTGTRRMP